jgi:hypothetical protein
MDHKHGKLWRQICKSMGLKIGLQALDANGGERREFSVEMFHHLLMRWVAVDDQVSSHVIWMYVT